MRVRWQFSLHLVFLLFGAVLAPAQTGHKMAKADIDRWMTELSNWGRWGKDDQLGTLNLITPAKRREAAALVKEGYSISLAHDVLTEKAVDNESPFVHTMLPPNNGFQIDNYSVSFHGMGQTHLDALCHVSYQGKIFNGFRVDQINASGFVRRIPLSSLRRAFPDAGRLDGLRQIQRCGLLETENAHLSRGPGGVGEADRGEGFSWRRALDPHGALGNACEGRSRQGFCRLARFLRQVAA